MDRIHTVLPDSTHDDARGRIEFCNVSADRQLETALITDGNGRPEYSAKASAGASAQFYAGDFFSPLLVAAPHHVFHRS